MIELAGIIILGILAQYLAWRLRVPAILPLILTGLFVGPISTLFTEEGNKLIEPIWTGTHGLFPGESLFYFVSLAIGIILFEGGLTLKRSEIKDVGPVIVRLISVGSFITFIGGGIAAHYIINLSWPISFLFAGLIIVTGPTVIAPILRNVPLNPKISAVLKWEGILIDPIGALVAVLVFEFINAGAGGEFTVTALIEFSKIVIVGASVGFTAAYFLYFLLKRQLIPHYLLNVFVLALVLGVFVLSDYFVHESGLLTVVVMGMVLGNLDVPNIKEILYFKESLSVLLISILFILLSANINIDDLKLLLDWRCLWLFGVVVLILRPLGVFLSTRNSELSTNDKIFISWVGPRGIVAAGIASLFGLKLTMQGTPGAEYITPLVFMIVLGTVLLNATTARVAGKLLGVVLSSSNGILIIGASAVSRLIGKYLQDNGRHVVMLDTNNNNINKAMEMGLNGIQANIYNDDLGENIELSDIGYLMAMTGSNEVNKFATSKFSDEFGENGTFRLITPEELHEPDKTANLGLFSHTDDYINLSNVARDYPNINEVELKSQEHYLQLINIINQEPKSIPLFVKYKDGFIDIIPSHAENIKVREGTTLAYMGKEIDFSEISAD